MDQSSQHRAARRKPYVKPEIMRVELRAEEAVLGSCKSATVTGPTGATCTDIISTCSTTGS